MPLAPFFFSQMITAELLANSFKHAYPNDDAHGPSVGFSGDARRWRLTVSDKGVGLPAGFEPTKGKSLGMRVITALVRRLNAGLTFKSSAEGTVFEISKD